MICTEEKTALLDEFSSQVQRHFPASVWRSLFLHRTGHAQFGSALRSILCVECPESGALKREGLMAALSRQAQIHAGHVDPCGDRFAYVSCKQPEQALRLACAVQRICARARLRMGIVTARCRVVRGHADGRDILMLLGKERESASALCGRAAAGSVQISPETYNALDEAIEDVLGSCVVMTEFEGDELTEVSLTLPPDASADLSTFAGLGLT